MDKNELFFTFSDEIFPAARRTFPELDSLAPDEAKAIECLITLKFCNEMYLRQRGEAWKKKSLNPSTSFVRTGLLLPPEAAWARLAKEIPICDDTGALLTAALDAFELANPRYVIGHRKIFRNISYSLLRNWFTRINEVKLPVGVMQTTGDLQLLGEYDRSSLPPGLWKYSGIGSRSRWDVVRQDGQCYLFATDCEQQGFRLESDILWWIGESDTGLGEGDAVQLFHRRAIADAYRYLGPLRIVALPDGRSELQAAYLVPSLLQAQKPQPQPQPLKNNPTRSSGGRVGQERYRDELLALWGHRCAVTGLDLESALNASHLQPFAECSGEEEFDKFNGVLVAAHIDKLIDIGMISFSDTGQILLSPRLTPEQRQILGLHAGLSLRRVPGPMRPYLAYHRTHVFGRNLRCI